MTGRDFRVVIDGHVHQVLDHEITACGLVAPFDAVWTDDPVDCPDEVEAEPKAEKPKGKTKK